MLASIAPETAQNTPRDRILINKSLLFNGIE
jgi:hypothetical protein